METCSGELEGSSEDLTGKKKSKLRSLKMRLFGTTKRKEVEGERRLSQSASDISQGKDEDLDKDEDFRLGTRALSHDSIFLADQCLSSTEPPQDQSQENGQSRIKILQMKLQQQNLRLGQPPLVMSIKRPEDAGGSSEDDGLPQSPPEIVLNEVLPQRASYKTRSPTAPIVPAPSDLGVDFSTPAQFTPCLDNSAARHRMSVKPRNQRASAKVRKVTLQPASRTRSRSMKNLELSTPDREDEKDLMVSKESIHFRSYSTQVLRTEESPTALTEENQLGTSNRRSLKEHIVPHQPSSPLRPPVQPRSVMTETVVRMSIPHSQLPLVKDQEPPLASVPTLGIEAVPVILPAADPKKNYMASESVGAKFPASPRTKSVGGTRQVGESLGIYPLKPAPTSAPSPVLPQRVPAVVPANKEENDKQCLTGSQILVPQNNPETADKKGNLNVNPQTEIRPKVQPGMAVHGTSEGFVSAKVSAHRQEDKPLAVENVVHSQQRPLSGSSRFTVSSANNKDRSRTGSCNSMLEETGAKKDLIKPNFSHLTHPSQEHQGVQKGDMKAKELPSTLPAEIPIERNMEPKLFQKGNSNSSDKEKSSALSPEIEEEAKLEEQGQDDVEEAEEAHEDLREHGEDEPSREEGEKNAFGIKLRSTSLSLKYRLDTAQSEGSSKQHSADVSTLSLTQGSLGAPLDLATKDASPAVSRANRAGSLVKLAASPGSDSLTVNPGGQNISSFPSNAGSRLRSRSSSLRQEDEANQTAVAHPPKNVSVPSPTLEWVSASSSSSKVTLAPTPSKQVSSAPLPSKDPGLSQPGVSPLPPVKEPDGTSSDFSWMSVAMEKTRTIQQLLTCRLPEFPEGPTLSAATLPKKEFISSHNVEGALAPSPSVKRKSASSPTKQMSSAPLPSKEALLAPSNDVAPSLSSVKDAEPAPPDVSWMSMAREKTRTIQQLFTSKPSDFPGPQAATKLVPTIESQPSVLQTAARPAQSAVGKKPSVQPSRVPKYAEPPDAAPTGTSQSVTTVLHSRSGQPIIKPIPASGLNPKPAHPTASQSPATQSIIRGTPLSASQPTATQPNIASKQVGKQAQSQQTTVQSSPSPLLINRLQPSPPLFSSQSIPHSSQTTANSQLSSSPKPPSHLKQQSQPTPPSIPRGSSDGLYSVKKRGDLPQSAPGRGSGSNTAEGCGPRATGMGSKAAFLEKWGDKGTSAGTKVSKTISGTQPPPESAISGRTGSFNRDPKTDKDPEPLSVLLGPTDREDRSLKRTLASSSLPQQPISDGGQPSWMEMAKRKSLAWSDKSLD